MGLKSNNIWVGDLETTNDIDSTRVWLSGFYDPINHQFLYNRSIDSTIEFMMNHPGVYYYHNLKFDGMFICDYLLKHNFICVPNNQRLERNQFSVLISNMGVWYSMRIKFSFKISITIIDSLKLFPMSVAKLSTAFGDEESKGEIDHNKKRTPNYFPTPEEIDYLRRDCMIVGRSLKFYLEKGLDKITQGSNAFASFKSMMDKPYREIFPSLPKETDASIRKAYRGGYAYVNPIYQQIDIARGCVYDKNSMYPWVMRTMPLPYGNPRQYEGKYKPIPGYPLYIQCIKAYFKLKPNHLPTIQDKSGKSIFQPTEYITECMPPASPEPLILYLTNIDLELFFMNYDVYEIEYLCGFAFKASNQLFAKYIDYWYTVKEEAARTKNAPLKQLAKLMLNALYGKFATNPTKKSKLPVLLNNTVVLRPGPEKEDEPEYTAVACFITAYARYELITQALKNIDRFIYSDTDSLHLLGWAEPDLDVDPYRLGAWDCEAQFKKARFIRAKTYMEIEDIFINHNKDTQEPIYKFVEHTSVKCAGLPHSLHDKVNWENFHIGLELDGKLVPKRVPGGVILTSTTFKISP